MSDTWKDRLKHSWDIMVNGKKEIEQMEPMTFGTTASFGHRPYSGFHTMPSKNNIIVPIYNRIGLDVASVGIKHVRNDEDGRFLEEMKSALNMCLTLSPNIDQISNSFFQDAVMTLCERGVIAIVPVETSVNPLKSGGFDISSLRIGWVVDFYPQHVKVSVYNDKTGNREDLILPKSFVAVVENPLYAVMNDSNSFLQRLLRKLDLLDSVDEQSSSGKLDIIMQLPYVIKTDARRKEAEKRRKDIQDQLKDSKYGIAYTDGTERITQLNRPSENNLMAQVEYLTQQVYSQLGMPPEIFNGTASEEVMINYFTRTVKPYLISITKAMTRTFLSKTARTQGQAIEFYRDPFELVPISQIAEIADKFTRNEIASANEIRTDALGWRKSNDPIADKLMNSNIPQHLRGSGPTNIEDAEIVDDTNQPGLLETKVGSIRSITNS